jgi:hypothetical protein
VKEDVAGKFDNEMEWVEDGWEDDYESEYDWYIDHSNEEAQDVVINLFHGMKEHIKASINR